jgi:hypothetical protein
MIVAVGEAETTAFHEQAKACMLAGKTKEVTYAFCHYPG